MEISVSGVTPEEVLDKAEGFAALEWPHRVIIKRDPDRLRLYKYTADSAIATVVYVIISVITLGLFVPVWALINLARWSGRSKARLEATLDEGAEIAPEVELVSGSVRIVTSGTDDYLLILDSWLRREFVYGRNER